MLSRTADSLYWLSRYLERADNTARIIDAADRLATMPISYAGESNEWESALSAAGALYAFYQHHSEANRDAVIDFLAFSSQNSSSIKSCLETARNNARAVRTALTREAWTAINRLWLLFAHRSSPGGAASTLNLVEGVMAEARGFEGAVHRMMHNEATLLIQLGAAIERADNTARLLDVKYHLLLPEGEQVGGVVDRDQWTTILQTVSAVTAYRWLYSEGLKPANVIDLLVARAELPRSLAACVEEVVEQLNALAKRTGLQGEADRMARARIARMQKTRSHEVIVSGLHEYLGAFIRENAMLDAAIARQFRFI
jgi:uncharacterized alpha-E superfamily protein